MKGVSKFIIVMASLGDNCFRVRESNLHQQIPILVILVLSLNLFTNLTDCFWKAPEGDFCFSQAWFFNLQFEDEVWFGPLRSCHRDQVAVRLQHHFSIQSLLWRVQVLPLLRGEIHSHILECHEALGFGHFLFFLGKGRDVRRLSSLGPACPGARRKPSGADSLRLKHSHQAPTLGRGQGERGTGRGGGRLRRGLRSAYEPLAQVTVRLCGDFVQVKSAQKSYTSPRMEAEGFGDSENRKLSSMWNGRGRLS